ncbi:MAG: glycosyltransferase family 2 protein [Lactococcus raffinolactis]|nr:glycosyltransferase family 2 protein [Lactococcus raffinolactis]MDN6039091.1 glycosyltransferase family 2 protein [Lactobacillus sp.]MDN6082201.1 glycosyltransferase family 2 protein [Lactococcus raffinolactis]MDN6085961.1 glycosyltransferase family 2 protein [Lactococcus raffinolactis]MDN6194524.1 glycosyltransferase family 2 protein [Alkalibacterium sp.]
MKINIVMSTYNGEQFLAEQIDSIQQQTFKDWQLLIRDDGSSDQTPEIIKSFVAQDPRIVFINEHDRENFGVIKNFFTLIKHDKADYYFFSDQDDVWLEDKLETMLAAARQYPDQLPLMVYTDLCVVDQNLQVMNQSMIRSQSHHANTELVQELTENTVTGGVAMINHALAERWRTLDNIIMHDWYLAVLATAIGKLVHIDQPGELYRQHDNNVLGARTFTKRLKTWLSGPSKMLEKYWWLIHASQAQADKILQENELGDEQEAVIRNYIALERLPLSQRIRVLRQYKYAKNKWFHTMIFRLLIMTRIGNKNNK